MLAVVQILVLHDLWEDPCDLLVKQNLELLFHVFIQFVLLTELVCQAFGGVSLIYYNSLHAVLADVDVNIELGVSLVDLVLHFVQLLVN